MFVKKNFQKSEFIRFANFIITKISTKNLNMFQKIAENICDKNEVWYKWSVCYVEGFGWKELSIFLSCTVLESAQYFYWLRKRWNELKETFRICWKA